jgi:hypothetical protein
VKTASGGPALRAAFILFSTDLVSEESARPTAPAVFQTVPATLNLAEEIRSSERAESAWPARWKTAPAARS